MKQPVWVLEEMEGVAIREVEALAQLAVTPPVLKSVALVSICPLVPVLDEESQGPFGLQFSVASRPTQSTDRLMP
jgi:hypothetical protein